MFAVGWGANQFSPMLVVYRHELGLTAGEVAGLFLVYALTLIPGLLAGGPASDRFGRRPVVWPFVALSPLATLLLVLGPRSLAMIAAGRALALIHVAGHAESHHPSLVALDADDVERLGDGADVGVAGGPVGGHVEDVPRENWRAAVRACLSQRSTRRIARRRPGPARARAAVLPAAQRVSALRSPPDTSICGWWRDRGGRPNDCPGPPPGSARSRNCRRARRQQV